MEDFLEDLFFSNLFLSFVEDGLESRSTGDRGLFECFDDFFLCLVECELKLRGPVEGCIAAAGAVMNAGNGFCCSKIGVLIPESLCSDSSSVCLPSTGYSTEEEESPECSL